MKVGRQLAQAQSAAADTAASIYSPAEGVKADVETIVIASTTPSGTTFSLYHDADGVVYNKTTALAYKVALAAYEQILIEFSKDLYMDNQLGNIAIESAASSAITVTIYGRETKR